jgi:hypothetical protein
MAARGHPRRIPGQMRQNLVQVFASPGVVAARQPVGFAGTAPQMHKEGTVALTGKGREEGARIMGLKIAFEPVDHQDPRPPALSQRQVDEVAVRKFDAAALQPQVRPGPRQAWAKESGGGDPATTRRDGSCSRR